MLKDSLIGEFKMQTPQWVHTMSLAESVKDLIATLTQTMLCSITFNPHLNSVAWFTIQCTVWIQKVPFTLVSFEAREKEEKAIIKEKG